MRTALQELSDGLAVVSDRVLQSLVQIRNRRRGMGAGVIWQPDGLIITNAHVVDGPPHQSPGLTVQLPDGRTLPARVVAVDRDHDLAALRVAASDLTPVVPGDSQQLASGDLVLALGYPGGVTGGATAGVVIGMGAQLPELAASRREWIAASLHLRPGHSGGPMVDSQGRLVGINTMMNGPDVGVAIPLHVVQQFLQQLYQPSVPHDRSVTVMV